MASLDNNFTINGTTYNYLTNYFVQRQHIYVRYPNGEIAPIDPKLTYIFNAENSTNVKIKTFTVEAGEGITVDENSESNIYTINNWITVQTGTAATIDAQHNHRYICQNPNGLIIHLPTNVNYKDRVSVFVQKLENVVDENTPEKVVKIDGSGKLISEVNGTQRLESIELEAPFVYIELVYLKSNDQNIPDTWHITNLSIPPTQSTDGKTYESGRYISVDNDNNIIKSTLSADETGGVVHISSNDNNKSGIITLSSAYGNKILSAGSTGTASWEDVPNEWTKHNTAYIKVNKGGENETGYETTTNSDTYIALIDGDQNTSKIKVTGNNIDVSFNKDNNTLTLSGTNGLDIPIGDRTPSALLVKNGQIIWTEVAQCGGEINYVPEKENSFSISEADANGNSTFGVNPDWISDPGEGGYVATRTAILNVLGNNQSVGDGYGIANDSMTLTALRSGTKRGAKANTVTKHTYGVNPQWLKGTTDDKDGYNALTGVISGFLTGLTIGTNGTTLKKSNDGALSWEEDLQGEGGDGWYQYNCDDNSLTFPTEQQKSDATNQPDNNVKINTSWLSGMSTTGVSGGFKTIIQGALSAVISGTGKSLKLTKKRENGETNTTVTGYSLDVDPDWLSTAADDGYTAVTNAFNTYVSNLYNKTGHNANHKTLKYDSTNKKIILSSDETGSAADGWYYYTSGNDASLKFVGTGEGGIQEKSTSENKTVSASINPQWLKGTTNDKNGYNALTGVISTFLTGLTVNTNGTVLKRDASTKALTWEEDATGSAADGWYKYDTGDTSLIFTGTGTNGVQEKSTSTDKIVSASINPAWLSGQGTAGVSGGFKTLIEGTLSSIISATDSSLTLSPLMSGNTNNEHNDTVTGYVLDVNTTWFNGYITSNSDILQGPPGESIEGPPGPPGKPSILSALEPPEPSEIYILTGRTEEEQIEGGENILNSTYGWLLNPIPPPPDEDEPDGIYVLTCTKTTTQTGINYTYSWTKTTTCNQ